MSGRGSGRELRMTNRGRYAVAWLTGWLVLALLLMTVANGWGFLQLVRHGATVSAIVTDVDPGNHCRADYAFAVGGKSYWGTGPDCDVGAGDSVLVTYKVSDPNHSCLGAAGDQLANAVQFAFAGGLVFSGFLLWRLRKWLGLSPTVAKP